MKHLLLGLLACVGFSACASIDVMSVDTLMPSDVSFAPGVRRVAVLNNMFPAEAPADGKLPLNTPVPLDGKVLAEELAGQLANAGYFETVMISDSLFRPAKPEGQVLFSPREVEQLTSDLQVDLLLTVDDASLVSGATEMYTPYSEEERVAVFTGALSLETRVYLPGRDRPFQRFIDRDTLYWELDGLTRQQIEEDATRHLAGRPVGHLVPLWQTVNRYFYRGGSVNMRDAAVCLQEGDWDLAADSWKLDFDLRKGKAKMRAAFNLALYSEMKGDLPAALRYLDEARNALRDKKEGTDYRTSEDGRLIEAYADELRRAALARQKLDLQMKRFNE